MCRHVLRNHTPGADHRIIALDNTWQDDRATTNPDVSTDPHRTTKLKPRPPLGRLARMIGGIDLHSRANLRSVADFNLDHVKDDAVEVHEYARPKPDVETVVAKERRP